jgi:hypothetical protein
VAGVKSDTAFLDDLQKSRGRVERFAAMCRAKGANVWVHPPVVRPDAESRRDFADDGDLMLQIRIEHKVRDVDFHDADDFPFETLIVDEVYKADRIKARPFRYVIENRAGTRVAVVRSATKPEWTVLKKYDAAQGRECEFYEVDKRLVTFCDFGPEALA